MPTLSFLFGGEPPPSVTTYGQQQTQLPPWLDSIVQGIALRGTEVAGQPLVQPNFPRIAQPTADQQAAYQQTRDVAGQTNAAMTRARGMPTASAAAQPYMKRAGATTPEVINDYMSPYTSNVTDAIARLGARNLHESLLPGINDTFIRSGMFGGDRNRDFVGRAVRDTGESVLNAQSAALQQGFQAAQTAAGADTDRAARAGQLAGQLSDADLRQILGTAVTGADVGLRTAAGLETIGAEQQQQEQGNLDLATRDFLEARGYPRDQLAFLNSLVRGLPYGQTTSTSRTGPADVYQPSLFNNLAGAGLTVASLANAFPNAASGVGNFISGLLPFKQGGAVRRPMRRKCGGALRAA